MPAFGPYPWCEKARKHMCFTNHHGMTLAVKVALNPNTVNKSIIFYSQTFINTVESQKGSFEQQKFDTYNVDRNYLGRFNICHKFCFFCFFSSVEAYGKESSEGFSGHALIKALGNFAGIFGGSFVIGSGIGMITALLTKYTKIRDFPLLETALFFLMSYASFQTAEAASLTGLL